MKTLMLIFYFTWAPSGPVMTSQIVPIEECEFVKKQLEAPGQQGYRVSCVPMIAP